MNKNVKIPFVRWFILLTLISILGTGHLVPPSFLMINAMGVDCMNFA